MTIRVEYAEEYFGGDYSGVGQVVDIYDDEIVAAKRALGNIAYLVQDLPVAVTRLFPDLKSLDTMAIYHAFQDKMGLSHDHIIHYEYVEDDAEPAPSGPAPLTDDEKALLRRVLLVVGSFDEDGNVRLTGQAKILIQRINFEKLEALIDRLTA